MSIEKNFNHTDVHIYGKKNQLKKAFFNLLKNAFEAIPDDGVIYIDHFCIDDCIHVTIRDTGVGIPQEKLKIIGTPFFTTKTEGTGMGLTQVFTVIYQHGGSIKVESMENQGTTFKIILPTELFKTLKRVNELELNYEVGQDLKLFVSQNRDKFQERLLAEAVNVKDKIDELKETGNIDLLSNAYKLVIYIIEDRQHEMILFAKEEGVAWARHSLTLAFKLEWIHAIRRVLWEFLYNFDRLSGLDNTREDFYNLEKRVNELVDQFLNSFFLSYSSYKDKLIESHRELIEDLSVPVIPINPTSCILPLIGTIDLARFKLIQDKILSKIEPLKIESLIIDLSGVAYMNIDVINDLIKLFDGIRMMGCKTVVTGIRKEIVSIMMQHDLSFDNKAETKRNLQQAIEDYLGLPNEHT